MATKTIPDQYLGVSLTQAQKDLLIADNKDIASKIQDVDTYRAEYGVENSLYNNALSINCGNNNLLPPGNQTRYALCVGDRNRQINDHRNKRDVKYSLWQSAILASKASVDKYNNDLASIKNTINLEIQSQQANTNASVNTPEAILSANAQQIQADKDKAQAKAASLNTTIKYASVVLIIIIVVWGAIKIFKK